MVLTFSKENDGLLCEVLPIAPGLSDDVINVQYPPVIEDTSHGLTGTQHHHEHSVQRGTTHFKSQTLLA